MVALLTSPIVMNRHAFPSLILALAASIALSGCGAGSDDPAAAAVAAVEPGDLGPTEVTSTSDYRPTIGEGVFALTAGATTTHLVACESPDERVAEIEYNLSGAPEEALEVTTRLRPAYGDGGVVVTSRPDLPQDASVSVAATCEDWDHGGLKGPFATESFWSAPLDADTTIDAQSDAIVGELGGQVREFGPWVNYESWSIPVYVVPRDQELVEVVHDNQYHPDLKSVLAEGVPIPPDAKPAEGTDRHLVIWQPSTDRMWEFWTMRRENDRWVAGHGGVFENVSTSHGVFATGPNWGSTATGLAAVGGLITLDDIRRGSIDHGLAFALPLTQEGRWVFPAQRSDGVAQDSKLFEGARFRLDPLVDVDELGLSPLATMMAKAVQSYGMVVRDRSDTVSFYGETPQNAEDLGLYDELLQGKYPNDALADFPWDKLQALELGERLTWPE